MSTNYYCDICQIICNGKKPYDQHLQSVKHTKKVQVFESQKSSQQSTSMTNSGWSSPADRQTAPTSNDGKLEEVPSSLAHITISAETMRILFEWNHPLGLRPYCDICHLPLYGGNNATVHFKSNNTVHNEKLANFNKINENNPKYSCKECYEIFSNENRLLAHLQSNEHASTKQQKENLQKVIKIYEAYSKLKEIRRQAENSSPDHEDGCDLENKFEQLKLSNTSMTTSKRSRNLPFDMSKIEDAMTKISKDED